MKLSRLRSKKILFSLIFATIIIGYVFWNEARVPKRTYVESITSVESARQLDRMIIDADSVSCLKPAEGFVGKGRVYMKLNGDMQVFTEIGPIQIGQEYREKIGSNLLSTPNSFTDQDLGNITLTPALTGTYENGETFGINLGRMDCFPDIDGNAVCQSYVSIDNPANDIKILGINVNTVDDVIPAFLIDEESSDCV